jgi:hypothetical protein
VFKKVHICLLYRLSNQLYLHHRGTRRKIQLTSYINFSPEIHIVSRYIVVRKSYNEKMRCKAVIFSIGPPA